MARGAIAKESITKDILNFFGGSFLNDKEIRIPFNEDGEELQIKVTLTCAKVNVDPPNGAASASVDTVTSTPVVENTEMTAEELAEVKSIAQRLNL